MKKENKTLKQAQKFLVVLVVTLSVTLLTLSFVLSILFGLNEAGTFCSVKKQTKMQNLTEENPIKLDKAQCLTDEECLMFEIPDQASLGPIKILDVLNCLSDLLTDLAKISSLKSSVHFTYPHSCLSQPLTKHTLVLYLLLLAKQVNGTQMIKVIHSSKLVRKRQLQ